MSIFEQLVKNTRSYRRFDQSYQVKQETLKELVNLARQTPSSNNLQSLKYLLSTDVIVNSQIFSCLKWAAKLNWNGPEEGQRPSAYIVIMGDKKLASAYGYDCGISAQTIMLGAVEKGLGGCMFGSVDRAKMRKALSIPEQLEILLVLAIGKPAEQVVLEELGPDGDVFYWRDEQDVHHVPKRKLEDVIWKVY